MKTPEERLFAAMWCMMMLDALDGPMELPESEPDLFGETTRPHMTEEQIVEYEARETDHDNIMGMSPAFVIGCQCVGYDPDYVREKYAAGKIQRRDIIRLFVSIRGGDD